MTTLTRLLYLKSEVEISFIWALSFDNSKEAIFWAMELFYSGFVEDILTNITKYCCGCSDEDGTYTFIAFANKNNKKRLDNYVAKEWKPLSADTLTPAVLYSFIYNLMTYTNSKTIVSERLLFNDTHVREYIIEDVPLTWDKLWTYRKYSVNDEIYTWFENTHKPTLQEKEYIMSHWLYYASFSPVWLHKIIDFKNANKNVNTNKNVNNALTETITTETITETKGKEQKKKVTFNKKTQQQPIKTETITIYANDDTHEIYIRGNTDDMIEQFYQMYAPNYSPEERLQKII